MKRPLPLFLALVCTLAMAAVLALPDTAQAGCRGRCEVAPGGGFCLKCVTADHETGVLCQQSGPCTCYFILCASALESSVDQFTTPDDVPEFLQPELADAERTPASGGECDLTAQIFGEWIGPDAD